MQYSPSFDLLFAAGGLAKNPHFDRSRFSFQEVSCSPLLSRNPLKSLKGALHLLQGVKEAIALLKRHRPHVVVGFGSYYTVATLLAAAWLKIPIILHEANSIPGQANRWLAPLATFIALHFPSAASFFRGKTVEVGLPLRQGYSLKAVSKEAALAYYGLSSERHTLLICGGSQGARAINEWVERSLPLLKTLSLQVIHLTGEGERKEALSAQYVAHQIPASVKRFENHMQMAWRAADAFLGRSGASTIAESIEFEVPGILIPYPYATDRHQEKNADFLVHTVGSAWKILECELTPERLENAIESLFRPIHYHSFKTGLKKYKERPNALTLCQLVVNTLGGIDS